ncbi:MAG: hypothetical protein J07AB43_11740, partial [Candidatus Nanosalina sp. J07AB43]
SNPDCSIPGNYTLSLPSGDNRLQDETKNFFPNEADNNQGNTATRYFMSYCDPTDEYGPNAQNHMQNNQLSGY